MQNLTILKQDHSGIKKYALSDRSLRLKIYALTALGISLVFSLGLLAAPLVLDLSATNDKQTIQQLQARVEAGQAELNALKTGVQNDIDAMTLQIGQLMAQSTRLNALGSRLTAASDINLDDFDLNAMPGLGGAELELTGEINTPQTVYSLSLIHI